jgi:hypothetical protein
MSDEQQRSRRMSLTLPRKGIGGLRALRVERTPTIRHRKRAVKTLPRPEV